jgi:hypothetical protein
MVKMVTLELTLELDELAWHMIRLVIVVRGLVVWRRMVFLGSDGLHGW